MRDHYRAFDSNELSNEARQFRRERSCGQKPNLFEDFDYWSVPQEEIVDSLVPTVARLCLRYVKRHNEVLNRSHSLKLIYGSQSIKLNGNEHSLSIDNWTVSGSLDQTLSKASVTSIVKS